jgi:soluble lytic murein transglycosylase-like protein
MGLMQLMPQTARQYQAGRNPYDPTKNIQAGTQYLRKLLNEFELPLALAAYNAGEGAVRRFGGIPPYAETQAYVKQILALVGPSFRLR